MKRRILSALAGGCCGVAITAFCWLLGLQSSYWKTLMTINISTGAIAGLAGSEATQKLRQRRSIDSQRIDRAIGAISERYALAPDKTQILIALEEFKDELKS